MSSRDEQDKKRVVSEFHPEVRVDDIVYGRGLNMGGASCSCACCDDHSVARAAPIAKLLIT